MRAGERGLLEPDVDAHTVATGNNKLSRALGSTCWHTRTKGLQALTRFLQRKNQEFDEKDMLKLWRGLFYAFWHSDKAPVQVQ
jgi:ribosomal RNA-processing protein 1